MLICFFGFEESIFLLLFYVIVDFCVEIMFSEFIYFFFFVLVLGSKDLGIFNVVL